MKVALVLFFRTTGGQTFVHRRFHDENPNEVCDDMLARQHADAFIAQLGEPLRATCLPPVNVVSSADHALSVPSAVRPLAARKRNPVSKFTYRSNFEPARGVTFTDAKQFGPKARAKRRSAWAKRAQAKKAKKAAREAELKKQGAKEAAKATTSLGEAFERFSI